MLDGGGKVDLTVDQFLAAANDCMEVEANVRGGHLPAEATAVLNAFAIYVFQHKVGF